MNTSATPLSAVKMMWSLSHFSCFMAFPSSLVKLALGGLDCLRILDISALSSSASVGLILWQATSIAVMYSLYGGSLGLPPSLVHVTIVSPVSQIGCVRKIDYPSLLLK